MACPDVEHTGCPFVLDCLDQRIDDVVGVDIVPDDRAIPQI